MTIPKSSFKKIAVTAALVGDSKKAHPVIVYDLAGKSPLADYAVLMEVESVPQLDAVEEEVQIKLKHEGVYCLHRDGMRSKNWKVLDYGGVLVHVYDTKAEEYYSISKVYADYKPVEWQEKPQPKPAAPAAKPASVKKAPAGKAAPKKAAVKKAPAKKAAKAKKAPVKKASAKKARPAAKKTSKKNAKKK
ncbi:MAG: ribosome silencing factor [Elusimicrobia bacterium GWC2_61_19]|nr:MAG: ribosome silencing factor [Elusimicrobia bacterium GWC2_61_19]